LNNTVEACQLQRPSCRGALGGNPQRGTGDGSNLPKIMTVKYKRKIFEMQSPYQHFGLGPSAAQEDDFQTQYDA
jgi:hypothetical protein